MRFKTIREATESWVHGMEFIHLGLIKDAVSGKEDVWHELTPLTVGTSVYCSDAVNLKGEIYDGYGEIVKISDENIVVRMYETDENALVDKSYVCKECIDDFPMWGTMFQPRERLDEEWIVQNLQKVADCGFRIYEHDDYGIYLGIDGCGYDFYSEHWIPLYKARGLQWHDERTEHNDDYVRKMLEDACVSNKIIETVMKIPVGSSIKIGGYYGGFLCKNDREGIKKCNHFIVEERNEKVQEMSHLEDNDYYIISREA